MSTRSRAPSARSGILSVRQSKSSRWRDPPGAGAREGASPFQSRAESPTWPTREGREEADLGARACAPAVAVGIRLSWTAETEAEAESGAPAPWGPKDEPTSARLPAAAAAPAYALAPALSSGQRRRGGHIASSRIDNDRARPTAAAAAHGPVSVLKRGGSSATPKRAAARPTAMVNLDHPPAVRGPVQSRLHHTTAAAAGKRRVPPPPTPPNEPATELSPVSHTRRRTGASSGHPRPVSARQSGGLSRRKVGRQEARPSPLLLARDRGDPDGPSTAAAVAAARALDGSGATSWEDSVALWDRDTLVGSPWGSPVRLPPPPSLPHPPPPLVPMTEPSGSDAIAVASASDEIALAELHTACHRGDLSAVVSLLADKPGLALAPDPASGATAVACAAAGGHVSVLEALTVARRGVWPPKGGEEGEEGVGGAPPPCLAAAAGHIEALTWLLEREPGSALTRGPRGASPLHCAIHAASAAAEAAEVAAAPPPRGAGRPPPSGVDAVARGRAGRAMACARAVLRAAAEVAGGGAADGTRRVTALRDAGGRTPLLAAAAAGLPTLVTLLVRAGSDLRATDAGGATALHLAAARAPVRAASEGDHDGGAACLGILLAEPAGRDPGLLGALDATGRRAVDLAATAASDRHNNAGAARLAALLAVEDGDRADLSAEAAAVVRRAVEMRAAGRAAGRPPTPGKAPAVPPLLGCATRSSPPSGAARLLRDLSRDHTLNGTLFADADSHADDLSVSPTPSPMPSPQRSAAGGGG